MSKILSMKELVPTIYEAVVEAPEIARKAKAGEFLVVMPDEKGERVPLTIADFDREKGTITIVFMTIGTSTYKLAAMKAGDSYYAFVGPLGHASEIKNYGTVVMVAGGVGTAPIYPIARELKKAGNKVISIQGARTKELLFWEDKLAGVSDEHIITTDDGTFGRKGLVTEPLKEICEREKVAVVYAIGPIPMMKFCTFTTKPFGVKTIVSLNSIMIDATGMCGGCRVNVGNETKFTCIDGPEFDGHQVDWNLLTSRQKIYLAEEKCSLEKYVEEAKK
ncbi:MAG: sulfide/dihydroorotate dehydrogenase-like FAD/NAD-binding protein [Candidatus Thermoplasmatota archaeon]|nr:sulfide/dihydroorotate dehydrogenase-like FAD/NAD-binding protein [Euryarchaeota archaeon]MBU4031483.1 sulfide/dihydroorotate dehydrogenase-like FAD/NAD-binding protein [Candidatus Thermoplasmatota archaeon]MBU4070900.1 sulfide/dihydroorotate dehydrogenase-like FAD/NAD-binding protein [Candidatus Thermoplasmatota archaeon]MBU4143731.1 sulfide/dihydroorotate dehydrogenase-like FAD/NAD-binding protein [Candidatus Thermoplasmatota archaeon]MBU4592414.1 sulfide/dihydroorotate dehydrogenase-like 